MGDERRINQLTAKAYSDIGSSDYFAVDNASEAESKKLSASAIKDGINGASSTANTASTNATRALNMARSTSSFPTGDAYSSSSAYKVGDMVIYNNTLYRCKTACSAASWSVNANNFESISLASAITDLNNDLSKNDLGSAVNLVNYTSSNPYTAPCDGIITAYADAAITNQAVIRAGSGGKAILNVGGNGNHGMTVSCYVRKGMKLYGVIASSATTYFFPLQ